MQTRTIQGHSVPSEERYSTSCPQLTQYSTAGTAIPHAKYFLRRAADEIAPPRPPYLPTSIIIDNQLRIS